MRILQEIAAIFIIVTVSMVAIAAYLDQPVVQVDSVTGECVNVKSVSGELFCSDADTMGKYTIERVSPRAGD